MEPLREKKVLMSCWTYELSKYRAKGLIITKCLSRLLLDMKEPNTKSGSPIAAFEK